MNNNPRICNRATVNATSSGDNTIIAATGSKILVWQYFLVNSHASQDENVTWKEGSTAYTPYLLKAAGGAHTAPASGTAWLVAPAGSAIVLNLSAAGTIAGMIYYSLEPA